MLDKLIQMLSVFGEKSKPADELKSMDNETLMALNSILAKNLPIKSEKYEPNQGYQIFQQTAEGENGFTGRTIQEINTTEGKRLYPGEGKSRDWQQSQNKAMLDAAARYHYSPADSITTQQLEVLKKLGLF